MNKKSTNTILVVFLSLVTLVSITLAIAAEQTESSEELDATEVTTQADPDVGSETSRSSPNITFIPTEDISEDLPVSFPADI